MERVADRDRWRDDAIPRRVRAAGKMLAGLENGNTSPSLLLYATNLLATYCGVPREAWVTSKADQHPVFALAQKLYVELNLRGELRTIEEIWTELERRARSLRMRPEVWANLLKQLAITQANLGQADKAEITLARVVAPENLELLSPFLQADILHQLGVFLVQQGKHRQAKGILEKCLQVASDGDVYELQAFALNQLGHIALFQGYWSLAKRHYSRELDILIDNGESDNLACVPYQSLGYWHLYQGEYNAAIAMLTKGLKIRQNWGERAAVALNQVYLATAYIKQGRLTDAETLLTEAIRTARDVTHRRSLALAHAAFAQLEVAYSRPQAAVPQWEEALKTLESLSMAPLELRLLTQFFLFRLRRGHVHALPKLMLRIWRNIRRQRLSTSSMLRLAWGQLRNAMRGK